MSRAQTPVANADPTSASADGNGRGVRCDTASGDADIARHAQYARLKSSSASTNHSGPGLMTTCRQRNGNSSQNLPVSPQCANASVNGARIRMKASRGSPKPGEAVRDELTVSLPLQRGRCKVSRQEEEKRHEVGLVAGAELDEYLT